MLLASLMVLLVAPEAVPATPPPAAQEAIAEKATPRSEIERLRKENEALQAELRRQSMIVDNARQQVAQIRQEMATKDELLELGRTRNAELYKAALEILDRYRRKDFGAVLAGGEPFVQKSRIRLENLVQDYEDRLRAARVTETTLPPSVEARMQQELEAQKAAQAAGQQPAAAPQN